MQAHVLITACDMYMRGKMGQLRNVAQEIDILNPDGLWNAMEALETKVTKLPKYMYHSIRSEKVHETARTAYDLLQVMRHRLAWDDQPKGDIGVAFDKPFLAGKQPPPVMLRSDELPAIMKVLEGKTKCETCTQAKAILATTRLLGGTESTTVGEGGYHYEDAVDVEGRAMRLVKEFEAASHNEAMQISNDHYGYGKYIPMDED